MSGETIQQSGCCGSDCSCGCRLDVFSVDEKCPACGGHLRLVGRSQTLQMRLLCPACGYAGNLLSPEEVSQLL
ncbi:MAG: hypothetical protein N2506_00850 [Dehalococcoidales bacterium]|nr:hypothetical protein [Dehalococcoidales bacterium]